MVINIGVTTYKALGQGTTYRRDARLSKETGLSVGMASLTANTSKHNKYYFYVK